MSLSTGTLNLKFMQRAAARNSIGSTPGSPSASASAGASGSTSTPSRPSGSSLRHETPSSSARSGAGAVSGRIDTPGSSSTPISRPSTPLASDVPLPREEREAMWVLPRSNRPTRLNRPAGGPAGPASRISDVTDDINMAPSTYSSHSAPRGNRAGRMVFESSYLPFMASNDGSDSDQEDTNTSTTAGGGRMAFGGFGKVKADDVKVEDEEGKTNVRRQGLSSFKAAEGQRGRREAGAGAGAVAGGRAGPGPREMNGDESKRHPVKTESSGKAGFMRPSNYNPTLQRDAQRSYRDSNNSNSSHSHTHSSSSTKEHVSAKTVNRAQAQQTTSAADKMRQSIASSRNGKSSAPTLSASGDSGPGASGSNPSTSKSSAITDIMDLTHSAPSSGPSTPSVGGSTSGLGKKKNKKRRQNPGDSPVANIGSSLAGMTAGTGPGQGAGAGAEKRIKLDNDLAVNVQRGEMDIDAREREMKAARKREKREKRDRAQAQENKG